MVNISGIVTSGICAVIFLIIGIGGPFLFDSLIQDGANQQVKLLPKQADQWAQIPGAVGATVLRNFTFYNFTNEYEVIFENAKPTFEEIGPYSFSENHNFTQLTYPPGAESVDFYFYQYFLPIHGTTGEEKINMINVGAMGAWYQMKHAGDAQLAISIFGDLVPSVKEQVMSSTIGLVMGLITFNKETTIGMIDHVEGLTESQKQQIAFDPNYGLGSFETNFPWIDMVYGFDKNGELMEQPDGSGEFQFLKNYFGLTYKQMSQIQDIIYQGNRVDTEELLKDILSKKYNAIEVGIIMGVLKKYIKQYNLEIIDTGVFGVYNAIKTILCTSYSKFGYECNRNLFGAVQWTSSGITNITGVIQGLVNQELENLHEDVRIHIEIPSIAMVNSTVIGAPEIAYYYESAFNNKTSQFYANENNIPNEFLPNKEEVVTWSMNAQETLEGDDFIKTPQAICNIGNLNAYYDLGNKYDAATNETEKAMYLQQFQERTYLWSENAAIVYWNYLKYMLHQFAEMQYIGGDSGSAALGSVIGQAQGLNFIGMTEGLLPLITSSLVAEQLKDQTCIQILMQGFTQVQSQQLCYNIFGLKTAQTLNQTNVADLISICNVDNVQYITEIMKPIGLTFEDSLFNLDQLCGQQDIKKDSTLFKDILGTVRAELSQEYGCNQPEYCTNYEIAIRQWNNTEITQNPTQAMINVGLNPAITAQDWIPELEGPFEWGYFCQRFQKFLTKDGEPIFYVTDMDQLTQLMSFDKIWAGTVISYAMLEYNLGKDKYIEDNFFVPKSQQPQLIAFFRWAALQAFGGFTFENTVAGALFGYVDPFVQNLKTMNPQQGGDPSIDDVIATSDLNITSPEAAESIFWLQSMYTGVGDMKNVRNYKDISGSNEIRVVTKAFNGSDIYTTSYNPYAEPVEIYGNDGSQSNPNQKEGQKNTIYITELYMGQELKQNYSISHHGLDCFRYQPQPEILYNKTMNPDNAKYYFDGPSGIQNMTSVQQAPLFNSQTHFYMAQQDLVDNITVTKNGMEQKPSIYDETYVDTEKITGVTLSVLLNLQLNYEMSPDLLFPIEYNRYLPIYYMYRGTNFTDAQIDDTFGALKDGLKAKLAVEIVGIILGILFVFLAAFLFYRYRKQRTDIDHQEIDDDEEIEQVKYQQITDKPYTKPKKEKINSTEESQFVTYLSDKK